MIEEVVKSHSYRLPKKTILQLGLFIIAFAFLIVVVSWLVTHFFNSSNPAIHALLSHVSLALVLYFIYVVVASVIVPIPTLPVDIVLLKLLDPASVITVRLLGGLAGGSISFYLSRNYGRPLLSRWLSEKNYSYVDRLSGNISWLQFFIIAMVPIVNTELMAYAGGISKLRFRMVMGSLAIAIFYRLLFVYFVIKA